MGGMGLLTLFLLFRNKRWLLSRECSVWISSFLSSVFIILAHLPPPPNILLKSFGGSKYDLVVYIFFFIAYLNLR